MRYRLKKTAAVLSVVWGSLSIIPTCKMKLTPFRRNVRSSSAAMPSNMDGACSSSSSVNIHCCSASTTAGGGALGGSRCGGRLLLVFDTITRCFECWSLWWMRCCRCLCLVMRVARDKFEKEAGNPEEDTKRSQTGDNFGLNTTVMWCERGRE